jgi:hypothetical protein
MRTEVSVQSVIWQECIDKELCIKLPFGKKVCERIRACIGIISENGQIYLEVEVFGKRYRYALLNACHTVVEWGVARLRLCIEKTGSGLRLVLEGCVGIDGVKKCWPLIAKDIALFRLSDLSKAEMSWIGLVDPTFSALVNREESDNFGAIWSDLSDAETIELLAVHS